ncbi:hypothetical protein B0H19DRAFT_1235542 [Mycena capillaripes]|nr:hypothetical protein B0H19DRAFT_1235542 [Mycena capillaripes]
MPNLSFMVDRPTRSVLGRFEANPSPKMFIRIWFCGAANFNRFHCVSAEQRWAFSAQSRSSCACLDIELRWELTNVNDVCRVGEGIMHDIQWRIVSQYFADPSRNSGDDPIPASILHTEQLVQLLNQRLQNRSWDEGEMPPDYTVDPSA